jgi:hypothetical protein
LAILTRAYVVVLGIALLGFLLSHTVLNYINYQVDELPWLLLQLFELDEENNLPTWFSSFLLLNNSIALLLICNNVVNRNWQWLVLAVGFLILSVDEVAGLHETFHSTIENNWTIYAAPLVLAVGLIYIPFLMALPRKLAVGFVISGSLYTGGALGVEWLAQDMDEETFAYALAVQAEDGTEMVGALLFLALNLNYLRSLQPSLTLELK